MCGLLLNWIFFGGGGGGGMGEGHVWSTLRLKLGIVLG